jgi:hypothetical protein
MGVDKDVAHWRTALDVSVLGRLLLRLLQLLVLMLSWMGL